MAWIRISTKDKLGLELSVEHSSTHGQNGFNCDLNRPTEGFIGQCLFVVTRSSLHSDDVGSVAVRRKGSDGQMQVRSSDTFLSTGGSLVRSLE